MTITVLQQHGCIGTKKLQISKNFSELKQAEIY